MDPALAFACGVIVGVAAKTCGGFLSGGEGTRLESLSEQTQHPDWLKELERRRQLRKNFEGHGRGGRA